VPVSFRMTKIGQRGTLGISAAAIFFALMVTNRFSGNPETGNMVTVGEEPWIHTGSKSTPLATTKDSYDEIQKILLAQDWAGLRQMIIQERAFVVEEGPRVLVVYMSWDWTMTQVRVLEGSQAGRNGLYYQLRINNHEFSKLPIQYVNAGRIRVDVDVNSTSRQIKFRLVT